MARYLIIADASYCPDTGAAGFAFHVEGKEINHCFKMGKFQESCDNSTVAEVYAVIKAFEHLLRKFFPVDGSSVKICTDCQQVILYLTRDRVLDIDNPVHRAIIDFKRMVTLKKLKVSYHHIKGHSDGSTKFKELQNKCDRSARYKMREQRETFKANGIARTVSSRQSAGDVL